MADITKTVLLYRTENCVGLQRTGVEEEEFVFRASLYYYYYYYYKCTIIVTLHKVAGALYIIRLKKTMAVVRSQLYDS